MHYNIYISIKFKQMKKQICTNKKMIENRKNYFQKNDLRSILRNGFSMIIYEYKFIGQLSVIYIMLNLNIYT